MLSNTPRPRTVTVTEQLSVVGVGCQAGFCDITGKAIGMHTNVSCRCLSTVGDPNYRSRLRQAFGLLRDEIGRLASLPDAPTCGACEASTKRLRDAEQKVFGEQTFGCDAADWMADEVIDLRKQVEILMRSLGKAEERALPDAPTHDASTQRECPRARSFMTPCLAKDGECAALNNGQCVGCGWKLETLDAPPSAPVAHDAIEQAFLDSAPPSLAPADKSAKIAINDTTQQNDGQKQADICPWDASMPLRSTATDDEIAERFFAVRNQMRDSVAFVAREYAEARTEALRLALFECATVGKRDRESAEATIGRLRAELASLRAASAELRKQLDSAMANPARVWCDTCSDEIVANDGAICEACRDTAEAILAETKVRAAQTPEITTEMVELAAKALLSVESTGAWELQNEEQHSRWRTKARAALTAALSGGQ